MNPSQTRHFILSTAIHTTPTADSRPHTRASIPFCPYGRGKWQNGMGNDHWSGIFTLIFCAATSCNNANGLWPLRRFSTIVCYYYYCCCYFINGGIRFTCHRLLPPMFTVDDALPCKNCLSIQWYNATMQMPF